MATPSYKFWEDFGVEGLVIIYLIWGTWIANFMFTSILMLNFLITVFSETHERVLANSINYTYLTRAKLNVECLAILKTFNIIQDIEYFVICSKMNEDVDEEVEIMGVITSLTAVMNKLSLRSAKR